MYLTRNRRSWPMVLPHIGEPCLGMYCVMKASNSRSAVASLTDRPDVRFLHRPANLEDLFLKLTGRDLRD